MTPLRKQPPSPAELRQKATGYEVARSLRAEPSLRCTRLVAITGYAHAGDREQAREAGFDEHLATPAPLSALWAALAKP